MKYNLQTYEKLVRLVKSNPCLYDASSEHYKDSRMQQNTWQKIAAEMDDSSMTWEDWKKLWKQKRDAFTKKRKELQEGPEGSGAKRKKKPPLFEQMSFLQDHLKSSVSILAKEAKQEVSDEEDEEKELEESDTSRCHICPSPPVASALRHGSAPSEGDESSAPRVSATKTSSVSTSSTRQTNNDRKFDHILEQLNTNSAANLEIMKNAVSKLSDLQRDEGNVLIFLSKKMTKFSKETQEWMEDETLKLYMEARRREREQATATTTS